MRRAKQEFCWSLRSSVMLLKSHHLSSLRSYRSFHILNPICHFFTDRLRPLAKTLTLFCAWLGKWLIVKLVIVLRSYKPVTPLYLHFDIIHGVAADIQDDVELLLVNVGHVTWRLRAPAAHCDNRGVWTGLNRLCLHLACFNGHGAPTWDLRLDGFGIYPLGEGVSAAERWRLETKVTLCSVLTLYNYLSVRTKSNWWWC